MTDNVELLPIDIHYNKLLDWLVSRRHCGKEWQKSALVVRAKINVALQDMPETEEIKTLLEGNYIQYFHCLKILELLKETESSKKGIFGGYASKRLKDWSEIIKLYEKDGVYLGEVAQIMSRNVNYEIPALKKQIAKCKQTQNESIHKQQDYDQQAAELRRNFQASCKKLGIQGDKIKSELAALVQDLPSKFLKLAESARSVKTAADFYQQFTSFFLKREMTQSDILPMLQFVIENGDVTTYQRRTGKVPEKVEDTSILIDTTDEQDVVENTDDIDWTGGEEIDFGDEIDFGIADVTDITVESGGTETDADHTLSVEEKLSQDKKPLKAADDGVARGTDALTILDNPDTRAEFVNDLLELEAFLSQRMSEASNVSVLSGSLFESAPSGVMFDSAEIQNMLDQVRNITEQLATDQMRHLLLIRSSPRYVERLKDSLKQTLTLADKMVFQGKKMEARRKEALEEQAQLEPQVDVLVQQTKTMQSQMALEVSKKYKDRPVNIMGEINTI